VLARSIIFEGYYPSLVFIARDKERFFSEFTIAKEYIIPCLDAATFILSLLHLYLFKQARDYRTEFFQATASNQPFEDTEIYKNHHYHPGDRRGSLIESYDNPYNPNLGRSSVAEQP
jgi:hypothetical protein